MKRCTYQRQNRKKMYRKYPNAVMRHSRIEDPIEKLINQVCNLYGVDPFKLKANNNNREKPYPEIRFLIIALAKTRLKISNSEAGAIFGKDRATAFHAVKTIRNLREIDKHYRQFTNKIFYS